MNGLRGQLDRLARLDRILARRTRHPGVPRRLYGERAKRLEARRAELEQQAARLLAGGHV